MFCDCLLGERVVAAVDAHLLDGLVRAFRLDENFCKRIATDLAYSILVAHRGG